MEDQDSFLTSSVPSSLLSHPPSQLHSSQSHQPHSHQQDHQHHQQHQQQHQQHQHQHQQPYLFGNSLTTFSPLSLPSSAPHILPSSSLPSSLPLALSLAVSDQHGRSFDYSDFTFAAPSSASSTLADLGTISNINNINSIYHHNRRPAPTPLQNARNKRTKLSSEERAKVLEIRRQRACLRCKMLKIQCSRDNPCKPCLSSAVRGYERKVLSFCYCVRTRFADVDIFHSSDSVTIGGSSGGSSTSMPTFGSSRRTEQVPPSIRRLMDQIEPPTLPVMEDNVFEDTLLRWLTSASGEYTPTSGSIVAMLYTIVGQSDSLRRAVDAHLPSDFQTFLFTTSLVHTGWQGAVPHRDLCIAGHVCGSRIVQRLDRILTPQFLAKCDKDTHRALLLLVFGLILGVSYSTRLTTSPSFPHDLLGLEMRHSPTLWLALKEHLAQMLAHHLIFLGSTLGIKLDTASEKTIIETAVNRWNKPERSLWAGKGCMDRGASVERHNDISLISRVFGLRGIQDLGSLQDLSGPPTSQTPRTMGSLNLPTAIPADGTSPVQALPSTADPLATSAPPSSSLPLVAVTYPDLTDLQSMPHMTSLDDEDHQYYQFHARPLHDALLDNNPESFYTMASDDLTGLLSPVTASLERPSEERQQAEDQDAQQEEQQQQGAEGDDNTSDGPSTPTWTPATKFSAPPPPSRNAMGNDGLVSNTRKRRSVWIVRPYSDNDTQEPVNVYARFRVNQGQNLGLFV